MKTYQELIDEAAENTVRGWLDTYTTAKIGQGINPNLPSAKQIIRNAAKLLQENKQELLDILAEQPPKPEPPRIQILREDQDPSRLRDKNPKSEADPYCVFCGRKRVEKTDFSVYDTQTGKPKYKTTLVCPGWWCRFTTYFAVQGDVI